MTIRKATNAKRDSLFPRGILAACALLAACSPVLADPLDAGSGAIFRLTPAGSYQEGCFPPCLCPIMAEQPVRGTLKFVYTGRIGGLETYDVSDVNWVVPNLESRRIIGSGRYEIGSPHMINLLEQRMQLALQVGGGPVEHFDSGWVPYGSNSPGNVSVTISISGMFCWDRVIDVDAQRVPPQDVQRFHLLPGSTYHHDCFGMCDCHTGDLRPMTGDFALVLLDQNPLFREFAVVDVHWSAISPTVYGAAFLAGCGFYRVGGEFAVQQQMILDLLVSGGGTTERIHFDSGLVVGGGGFPHIDLEVPQFNVDNLCTGTILHVTADPADAEICGGITGIPCPADKFCKLPVGECCCDHFGRCAPIPDACPEYNAPVCGCDGLTYSNVCFADAAAVSIAHFGPCEAACRPADNGQGCMPAACSPIPEVQCLGAVLHLDVHTGGITTLACECLDFNFCHIEFGNASPVAVGYCPNGGACHVIATDSDGDGIHDTFRAGCDSMGACCSDLGGSPLPVPICTEVPADVCNNAGIFLGVGTTCGPPEACCLPVGSNTGYCVQTSAQCCLALGGQPQGPNTFCGDPTGPNICSPRYCRGWIQVPCFDGEFCKFFEGVCTDAADDSGICTPIPAVCPDLWAPVCGCDGVTYGNECEADAAAVSILHRGPCGAQCGYPDGSPCDDGEFCKLPFGTCDATLPGGFCAPIPTACPPYWDPVCGCDGVTYGNECEADAAAVSVFHHGPCDVRCGYPNDPPCGEGRFCKRPIGACDATIIGGHCAPIPEACITLWDPVCGCDNVTYPNECEADRIQVPIDHFGPCETNVCVAVRHLAGSNAADFTYCPGEEKSIVIEIQPPPAVSAMALEDSPPFGWWVTSIGNGGFYDSANNNVKWGPFFAPFPASVSYAVVPGNDIGGVECFHGAVSVDGVNQPICGDACLQPCCPHIPADSAHPSCADCPMSGCTDCTDAACEDGQVSLCEVIGYACAWLRGCNDDLSGMTRAAYLWRNGECYCRNGATQNWQPAACGDAVCCGTGVAGNQPPASPGSELVAERVLASIHPIPATRGERGGRFEVKITLTPSAGVSAAAVELLVPKKWRVIGVEGGHWDDTNRKAKWGPFFDDLSRTLTVTVQNSERTSGKDNRLGGFEGPSDLTGTASFDGMNYSFKVRR